MNISYTIQYYFEINVLFTEKKIQIESLINNLLEGVQITINFISEKILGYYLLKIILIFIELFHFLKINKYILWS